MLSASEPGVHATREAVHRAVAIVWLATVKILPLLSAGEPGVRATHEAVHRAVAGRLIGRVEQRLHRPFM